MAPLRGTLRALGCQGNEMWGYPKLIGVPDVAVAGVADGGAGVAVVRVLDAAAARPRTIGAREPRDG